MSATDDFDFFSDEFQADPHPVYAAMIKGCPVAHQSEPFDWFAAMREKDIAALLRDYKTWTSHHGPGLGYHGGGVLVNVDPPQHTRDRRLVNAAFRPADLLAMEDDIVKLMDEQIDSFIDKGEGDLMQLFATPIPMVVIAWLLGLDTERVLQMRPRADGVISRDADKPRPPLAEDPRRHEIYYFLEEITKRREMHAAGEDMPQDTLTSLVVTEVEGRTLSDQEVVGFMSFLFIAGSQTTTQLIGNMTHRLLTHPDQMAALKSDRSLDAACVEESLRYDPPVHGLFRTNTEETELQGVTIPENSKVLCTFFAANLDPDFFENPLEFDITRDMDSLKKHYSFGKGIHYCMGAPLSRLEGRVALNLLIDRLPNLRLTAPPTEIEAPVLHGVENLHVAWDPPATVSA